ncbi:endonuclease/exonuclease/phosphatase family protein [Rhizobium sp. RM]|uniref:endonuclease/exonuclease/phosphatase family protein n=1 Tax=Rhizobium sp. RM TaxID=2748079 RepID=UPI00110D2F4F|nr:endonuclease/exonuclease/phosphatase family protein [Rhizobium sp. RM]NWJ24330.1 endonuclease/exonuclease/phosphatase family protein [Rhizobium sp. RM]TMV21117.1 endonuclease [Rhizobium sp. Td3]
MRIAFFYVVATLLTLALATLYSRFFDGADFLSLFYSLQLHFSVACALVALVLVAIKTRSLYAWFMLFASCVLIGHSFALMRASTMPPVTEEQAANGILLRVLSFNILFGNPKGQEIADIVRNSGADVVAVMEAHPLRPHLEALKTIYPYRLGCASPQSVCDLMLLSKYPLMDGNFGNLSALWKNRLVTAAVSVNGKRVNLVAAHLSKPYYDEFHRREAMRLARLIANLQGPVVLTGDFNASSMAPDMQTLLRTSGLHKVLWEAATWPVRAGAYGIAIDHVYVRAPMRFRALQQVGPAGSNHYGVLADLVLTEG